MNVSVISSCMEKDLGSVPERKDGYIVYLFKKKESLK